MQEEPVELDANVVLLMEVLTRMGARTVSSCGGHPDGHPKTNGQRTEPDWFASFYAGPNLIKEIVVKLNRPGAERGVRLQLDFNGKVGPICFLSPWLQAMNPSPPGSEVHADVLFEGEETDDMRKPLTCLGIDLGQRMAWAAVRHGPQGYELLAVGEGDSKKRAADCLRALQELPPVDLVAAEQIFHSEGKPTAHRAEAGMGIVRIFTQERGLSDPVRLLPNFVKQCATGDPGADKQLVRRFVSGLFPRFATGDPVPWKHLGNDATDAASIAYAGVVHAEAAAVGLAA